MDFVSDDPDFAVKCWVDPNCTKFSVVLWLQGGDAEEQCKQLKQYLEKAGGDLKMPWECGHGKKGKGFVVKTTWKLNLDDKETSAKQHKRIVDAVQEIRDVLIPRLRKSDD